MTIEPLPPTAASAAVPATSDPPPKTFDSVVVTVFLLLAATGVTQSALGGILPLLQRDLGLSHTEVSLHITAMSLGGASMSVMVDRLRRRCGRPVLLFCSGFLTGLGAVGLIVGKSLWVLLPAMVSLGWAMCIVLVLGQSMMVSRNPLRRDRLVASFNLVYAFGVLAIVVIFPWLVSTAVGWRGLPWTQLVMTVALVLPLLVIVMRGRTDLDLTQPRPEGSGKARLRYPLIVTLALAVAVEWAIVFWLITYLNAKLTLTDPEVTQATLFLMSGFFVARCVGMWLLGVCGARVTLIASLALSTVAAAGALVTDSWSVALAVLAIGGFAAGNIYPSGVSWLMTAHPGDEDKAMARASVFYTIGTMIFPLLLGLASDNISLTFAISMLLVLSALAAFAAVSQQRYSSPKPH